MTTTSPNELAKFIEYRLSKLGEENAHHHFEELCFRIARAEIASHIIPPTGPVSAGGDQGRDFESYRLIDNGGNVTRIFASCVSAQDTVVFACTVQKGTDGVIASKAKSDIEKIDEREPKPDVIYFFHASNTMAPAARHDLQDWANTNYNIHLEVIGQRTIAEMLSKTPNQWIAQQYLQIPEAMLDPITQMESDETWYNETKQRFQNDGQRPGFTYGEVANIARCARQAWQQESLDHDDGLWLDLLADIWSAPGALVTETGLKAFYEAFVYLFRGRRRGGLESYFEQYVDGVTTLDSLSLLKDAQCFVQYVATGFRNNTLDIDHSSVEQLIGKTTNWIDKHINNTPGQVVLSELLMTRGLLCLTEASLETKTLDQTESTADEILYWWQRTMDIGESLNAFPVLHLNELASAIATVLVHSSHYDDFMQRVDCACEQRHTDEGIAATMRMRGMHFYQRQQYLHAISPLLKAKRHWHNGDRVRGSLLTSLFAQQSANELQLKWASLYMLYDNIAVMCRLDDLEHGKLLSNTVLELAQTQYVLGQWAHSIHTYSLGYALHLRYQDEPLNETRHSHVTHGAFYLANMLVGGEALYPGFKDWGLEQLAQWELEALLEQESDNILSNWQRAGLFDGWITEETMFYGIPLSDFMPQRSAQWRALDAQWCVTWPMFWEIQGSRLNALLQLTQIGLAKHKISFENKMLRINLVTSKEDNLHFETDSIEQNLHLTVAIPDTEISTEDWVRICLLVIDQIMNLASEDEDLHKQLPDLVGNLIEDACLVGGDIDEGYRFVMAQASWSHITEIFEARQWDTQLQYFPQTQI